VTPPSAREGRTHFRAIGESLPDIGRSEAAWQTEQYV
jgi:hypothetical protein